MTLRPGERTRLQVAQEAHMHDTCVILARSAADDAYNLPNETFTPGAATACGYRPNKSREVQQDGQVIITDGQIRLPLGTVAGNLNRIQLTHRFGELLATPLLFQVVGHPAPGPSGLVADVKEVAGG